LKKVTGHFPLLLQDILSKKIQFTEKLVKDEPRATIIKEALEGYAAGRFYEQMDVLRFLKESNYSAPRGSKKIYPQYVKRLLTRDAYAGYISYPEWGVDRRIGHHDPLISSETFYQIQDRLNGKKYIRTRKDLNPDFPLRGMVTCSDCGKALTASWSTGRNGKHPYYRCGSLGCPMRNKSIKKSAIESSFESLLRKIDPKPELIEYMKAKMAIKWNERISNIGNIKKELEKELYGTQEDIAKFINLAAEAKNPRLREAYENKVLELSEAETKLKDKLTRKTIPQISFGTALEKTLDNLRKPNIKWVNGDLNAKRQVFKLVFSELVPYSQENGFGTAKLSLPLKVFELIGASKTHDVEMGGIEPPCKRFS
jgi:site-specific DNA recombinase